MGTKIDKLKIGLCLFAIIVLLVGCKSTIKSSPSLSFTQTKSNTNPTVYSKDSIYKIVRQATSENSNVKPFYYFNNEWIPEARIDMVSPTSIFNIEIKDDSYGNRAIFVSLPTNLIDSIKLKVEEETKGIFAEYGPFYEFPGGSAKMSEWLKENIRIPEELDRSERVVVSFKIQPDGLVSDAKMIKASKNDLVNKEALRLVKSLPKIKVWYYTPKKEPINVTLPILFEDSKTI